MWKGRSYWVYIQEVHTSVADSGVSVRIKQLNSLKQKKGLTLTIIPYDDTCRVVPRRALFLWNFPH